MTTVVTSVTHRLFSLNVSPAPGSSAMACLLDMMSSMFDTAAMSSTFDIAATRSSWRGGRRRDRGRPWRGDPAQHCLLRVIGPGVEADLGPRRAFMHGVD